MRAFVYRRYGSPDVLERVEIDRPEPGDAEVLVRVHAVGINPYDSHFLRGDPLVARPMLGTGLRRPTTAMVLGSDIAGVVEATGKDASRFRPGDAVYGTSGKGGCADFVAVPEAAMALKPANLSFVQAAAVPMAGYTALQGLRDFGRIQPGQTVIINGASGGVGSFAVQIARALGASEVTGVCSTANVDLVRSLGATRVIDYTRDDFTGDGHRYDMLVDTVGNRSIRALTRAVKPKGTLVIVGGGGGHVIGPLGQIVSAKLQSRLVSPTVAVVMAKRSAADLALLAELIEAGKVAPTIDRTYPLDQTADAMRYLETRHARGKVVITVVDLPSGS